MKFLLHTLCACIIIICVSISHAHADIIKAHIDTGPLKLIEQYSQRDTTYPAALSSDKDVYFVVMATASTSDFYVLARPTVDPRQLATSLETAVKGTSLETQKVAYMQKKGYTWADVCIDNSRLFAHNIETYQPVGTVTQALLNAGYKPHLLLLVLKTAKASPAITVNGMERRKWKVFHVNPVRTDLNFTLSGVIPPLLYGTQKFFMLGPLVFGILLMPVMMVITKYKEAALFGKRTFFTNWYSWLMISFFAIAMAASVSTFYTPMRRLVMDIWFGQEAKLLLLLPLILVPFGLIWVSRTVARWIYRDDESESDVIRINKSSKWYWIGGFIVIVFILPTMKGMWPSNSLFAKNIIPFLLILAGLLEYVYSRTLWNLPKLRGNRTQDDNLLAHLSGISSRLGLALKQVYRVEVSTKDNSCIEAVYQRDGTLLVRRSIFEPVEVISKYMAPKNESMKAAMGEQLKYGQDEIDFICAREMALSALNNRAKSLLILYIAFVLILVPGIVFLLQSSNLFPLNWKFWLCISGAVLMLIDHIYLNEYRDMQVDQLVLSITGNISAALKTVLQPWSLYKNVDGVGQLDVTRLYTMIQNIKRQKRLNRISEQENSTTELTASNIDIDFNLTSRARDLASRMGIEACSVEIIKPNPDEPRYYYVHTRKGLIGVCKAMTEDFTPEEMEFVLAYEQAKAKYRLSRMNPLFIPAVTLMAVIAPILLIIHDLRIMSYVIIGILILAGYSLWAVSRITKKPELSADKLALRATRNPTAAISAIEKQAKNSPFQVNKAVANTIFTDPAIRIAAIRKEADKMGI